MTRARLQELSRREREMMNIIYRLEEATAAEVRDAMAAAPSYSAVRATLRILEEKGMLRHREDGPRYVYRPTVPVGKARESALRGLLRTFFDDSPGAAAAALLDMTRTPLPADEYRRLRTLLDRARAEGEK